MATTDPLNLIFSYAHQGLTTRKQWYTPAAQAYAQSRPGYPPDVIAEIQHRTGLGPHHRLLEIGCGPGTATLALGGLGCSMVAIEPNASFVELARHRCHHYPQVTIVHSSLEEYEPPSPWDEGFDVVVAASSFHWIPPEYSYAKVLGLLKPHGHLVLLWNKELQPPWWLYQHLAPIYQTYAPHLDRYEDQAMQQQIFERLGHTINASGLFTVVAAGAYPLQTHYSIDRYLQLLSTYSPYLQLAPPRQRQLFQALKATLQMHHQDPIPLWNQCGFHFAQPTGASRFRRQPSSPSPFSQIVGEGEQGQ